MLTHVICFYMGNQQEVGLWVTSKDAAIA